MLKIRYYAKHQTVAAIIKIKYYMKEKFLKFWKDPVWSKVISAGLIAILIFIYNYCESLIKKESFKQTLKTFLDKEFKIWQFAIITFLFVLIIFIYKKYKPKKIEEKNSFEDFDLNSLNFVRETEEQYDEESKNADKKLFNDIRTNILPSNNGIYWIRNQNFRGFSFNPKNMRDFDEFEEFCRNPNNTFLNNDLEELKNKLNIKISKFTELIGLNTWSTDNGLQTVPPEWEIEQPERFIETVNKIHSVTFEIVDLYDEFIKTGKKILKI